MTLPDSSRPDAPPTAENHELHALLGKAFEEKPIWTGLYEGVRDAFFPPKLPPLELTSTPIPALDRMAVKTNPWAVGTATILNGALLSLLLCLGLKNTIPPFTDPAGHPNVDLGKLGIFAAAKAISTKGGPGGGSNDLIDAKRGRLPEFEKFPLVPPQVPLLENPRLPMDSAVAVPLDMKLPDNPALLNVGVHHSTNVALDSNGPGRNAGIGSGSDGGVGPGNGPGAGQDGGYGSNVLIPGGAVSAPVPLVSPEAEFSDEARRQKFQGICMIAVIVDAQGNPRNPRVTRHLGMGLDEKALEAVRRYKFKPAKKDGKPVPVLITVEVNFRLY